jgi:signal transduction histidine kinase
MDFLTVVKRNWIVFSLSFAAALAMIFISEGSYLSSAATLDRLGSMGATRIALLSLARDFVDAETGQRGYLVTGRKDYREPYDLALLKIDESFKYLRRYYQHEAAPLAILEKMESVATMRLSELALTIRLFDEGKADAAKEVVLSNIGSEQMDSIRAFNSELLQYESQKVERSRNDVYRAIWFSRIGVTALSAVCLLALFIYLRQTFALKQQQMELQALVQAERDRLEVEVVQRTEQLTVLTRHLLSAREDERSRLARNLHDDLGALLTSAKLDAARIKSRIGNAAPQALDLLAHLVTTLNSSISLGRGIIENLRPSALTNLGLAATIEILASEFGDHSGIQIHCDLDPVKLNASGELMVYRLVQEATTNIAKYAKAQHVWIKLSAVGSSVEVSVRDDGVGFDVTTKPISAFGLIGMRFRVEAEGGSLAIQSAPGKGTLIQARLQQVSQAVDDPANIVT